MNTSPEETRKTSRSFSWASARRVLIAAITANACLVAVAFIYAQWHQRVDFEVTDNAYIKGDLTFISSKVGGYVIALETEDNRYVTPGETLVRIDPADYQVAVLAAKASVEQQNAALAELQEQQRLQGAQVRVADAEVEAAQASFRQQEAEYLRAKALVVKGAVSRQLFDQTETAFIRARASLAQARSQAEYARQQLKVLSAQQDVIAAQLKVARASLQRAQIDLDQTEIKAPREGRVSARNVRLGEYVSVGSRLMAISPTRDLWVEANLRETQLARMRSGDRVQIEVDAFPGQVFCGYVESISGASGSEFAVIPPDNASGNFTKIVRRFPVRILFDPDQSGLERLGVGMSVVPVIALGSGEDGRSQGGVLSNLLLGTFQCDKG
ncbi:HlyD family secretion protein [Pseudomonas sp. NCCP-436]|uniref:HlyD family secretion protein n=1 Tax=Pseudomonas sp. NCCP-436 TaxID=2842481 RepID=UPI001C7F17ED|nr:HlyD family secretion protein [Pseudomonas sp. NCCP-436]GIZ10757.1 secretion protein HlyD [Pseudomonas sp. NCCP-436]